jgi:tetratricopeptide (TPR) repeat protein
MQFTNSMHPYSELARRVALVALVAAAFLSLPAAADPYQPVRALLVAGALVLALLSAPGTASRIPRWVVLSGVALVVWYVLAVLLGEPASSVWGVHGRFQALFSFLLALVAALAGWIVFHDDMRWFARAAAVGAALQGAFVIYQAVAGELPVGTIGNRALLGAWLAVASTGAIASWRMDRSAWRWAWFACAAVGAVGLGLAGSRGAWLGLIAGAAVVVIGGGVRRGWPVIALGTVLVVAALGIGGEAAQKLDPVSLAGGSASSRVEIWRGSGQMIAANPVFGVGPGRFLYEFPQYQGIAHARAEALDTRPDVAHSHVLQMASEAGIPAALLLIALAGAALAGGVRGVREKRPSALVALAMFAAYVTQAVFGIGTVETDVLGWMLGGVLVGMLATDSSDAWTTRMKWAGVGTGVLLATLAGYYLAADLSYSRGLSAFAEGRVDEARASHDTAVASNPLVDIYRVGQSDPALFLGPASAASALQSVERGLELEPMSYDLALARARLIASSGASPDDIAEAYLAAVELYPLGVNVRLESAVALLDAGRAQEARQLAEDVLLIVPDDPTALAIMEAATDG